MLPLQHREPELHAVAVACLLGLEVPLALVGPAVRAPAEADRAVGQHHLADLVERDGLPVRVVGLAELAVEVAGAHVAVGDHDAAAVGQGLLLQQHQHRQVGVAACVIVEVLRALLEVELLQDHVAHRHRERRVGALLGVQPEVAELADLGVVGRDRDRLRTLVAHLGEEVRVGRARLRHVAAPGDQVGAVVPIGRLWHVGLLAPDLRAGRRQVAVPVVEAHADAADQRQVARARGVADHRHRRDRREADHAIRAVGLDGVHVRRGDDLVDLVPARAHEAAQAAHALVVAPLLRVADDAGPGFDRAVGQACLAPGLEQPAAHHRVLHAVRAVEVPAVARAARAAARLVVGHVEAGARVVGLLRLPGDDAALHVDLPRAGTGAVHAVGGAHDLVVRPAVAVGVLPGAVLAGGDAVAVGERLLRLREVGQSIEEVTHRFVLKDSSRRRCGAGRTTSSRPGRRRRRRRSRTSRPAACRP
jgi:predicted XRE-type DNA-binding protein